MCPIPVCVPDDGCFSECCPHRGRAASTPAPWPRERPHWLLCLRPRCWPTRPLKRVWRNRLRPAQNIRSAARQSPRDLAHALRAPTPQDDISTAGILGTHAARTQPATKVHDVRADSTSDVWMPTIHHSQYVAVFICYTALGHLFLCYPLKWKQGRGRPEPSARRMQQSEHRNFR